MTPTITTGMVRLDQIRVHPHNIRHDLGDLRVLTDSIRRYGVMQPVVVEHHNGGLRLRAGHRRLAAARLAGKTRIPAVIHPDALEDDEWLVASIQENTVRANLDRQDRHRAIVALRELGCTYQGIADAFGTTAANIRSWAAGDEQGERKRNRNSAKWAAIRALIDRHRDEFDQLLAAAKHETAAS